MNDPVRIEKVEIDGADGVIVTFSDGTIGAYVVEELLDLRPRREQIKAESSSGQTSKKSKLIGRKSPQTGDS